MILETMDQEMMVQQMMRQETMTKQIMTRRVGLRRALTLFPSWHFCVWLRHRKVWVKAVALVSLLRREGWLSGVKFVEVNRQIVEAYSLE
tara:strand:+ start:3800 stop:4069 length:270 start_codon:yes stop_codon:yes gene_type:complete